MKNIFALAILVSIAALAGCGTAPDEAVPSAKISVNSESIASGTRLEVSVSALGMAGGKVEAILGAEKQSADCTLQECSASFSFTPKEGAYYLKVSLVKGGISREASRKRIEVHSEKGGCLDGTAQGACSASGKPLYCDGKSLVGNCTVCGCNQGYYCVSSGCVPEPALISGIEASFPEKIQSGRKFSVHVSGIVSSDVSAGAAYSAELIVDDKKFTKEFEAVAMRAGSTLDFYFSGISLSEGTYDYNLNIFARSTGKQVGASFGAGTVHVAQSLEPPSAPSITGAFAEGNDVVLEWDTVEGADSYRLYKSSEVSAAFISYMEMRRFGADETTAVVHDLSKGTHFFVMTAVDAFGNESAYGNVKQVSIG